MKNNVDKPLHYIRKGRHDEAMIYLKDGDNKASQRLFCYMYATDHNIKVLDETTNIEEVKNCDILLVASASVLTRDVNEYYKIEKKLRKQGIEIVVVVYGDNVGKYLDKALDLFRKGRI